jgi:hypothetical protein
MRKVIFILIILLFIVLTVRGEKIGVLPDLMRPGSIEVTGDRLYVVEGAVFYVYALNDLHLITKLGKEGEGPGELKVVPIFPNSVRIRNNNIITEGFSKLLFFSKGFKLLKELKKKGMIFQVIPVGENFVGTKFSPTGKNKNLKLSLLLINAKMDIVKELCTQEIRKRDKEILMVVDSLHFSVYKDKIYIERSEKGFLVEVLDSNGKKLYEIKKSFPLQEVTGKYKEEVMNHLKMDSLIQMVAKTVGGWENFKKESTFNCPEAFPLIQDIIVTNDKIYVSTYERKENKEKYIIMDLNGKIVGTPYLPVPRKASYSIRVLGLDNRLFGIINNKYYYLYENEDEEEWELHVEEIK